MNAVLGCSLIRYPINENTPVIRFEEELGRPITFVVGKITIIQTVSTNC